MQITNFRRTNREKGTVLVLATFSVDFGAFDVNGWEIIQPASGDAFVSKPNNWNSKTKKEFPYIFFKKGEGQRIYDEIVGMAFDELDRRGAEPEEPPRRSAAPQRGGGYQERSTPRKATAGSQGRSRPRPQYNNENDYNDNEDLPY